MQLITSMIDDQMVKSAKSEASQTLVNNQTKPEQTVVTGPSRDQAAAKHSGEDGSLVESAMAVLSGDSNPGHDIVASSHHQPVDLSLEMEDRPANGNAGEQLGVPGAGPSRKRRTGLEGAVLFDRPRRYCDARTDTQGLPSDVEAWVEVQRPAVIVIAIVPPDGFIQAKYLCQQLHQWCDLIHKSWWLISESSALTMRSWSSFVLRGQAFSQRRSVKHVVKSPMH